MSVLCLLLISLAAPAAELPTAELSIARPNDRLPACDSLLDAVLEAEGVDDARERVRLADHFHAGRGILDARDATDPLAVADRLLKRLHRHVLSGEYQETCPGVHETLRSGDYNCLSASVLFLVCARQAGIEAIAVSTPGHVFCRIRDEHTQGCDVQTTSADGLKRSADPDARPLTDQQLLAKVLYNRSLGLAEQLALAQAVQLLKRSRELDPHDPCSRQNLAAMYNNWALLESRKGHFRRALELLDQAAGQTPATHSLRANYLHVYQRWAMQRSAEHRYPDALAALAAGRSRWPSEPLFSEGPRTVYQAWIDRLIDQRQFDAALDVVQQAGAEDPSQGEHLRQYLRDRQP